MESTAALMEYLFRHQARSLPPQVLADIFDRLIWILEDNGEQVCRFREQWLEGENVFKIEIALHMDEVYPYDNQADMERALSRISKKWPQFEARCNDILTQRAGQLAGN